MKEELEHARRIIQPLPEGVKIPTTIARKSIREDSDFVIYEGLQAQNIPTLATGLAKMMLTVAVAIDTHDFEPEVGDLITGSGQLLAHARDALDRALQLEQWDNARAASVMVELVARGLAATLSLPYSELLAAVASGEEITPVLVKCGAIPAPSSGPSVG